VGSLCGVPDRRAAASPGIVRLVTSIPPAGAAEAGTEAERDAIAFVLSLGRALHRYGTPAHRLEEALLECCRRLGSPRRSL
jgi:uncharacterized RmlC-like cupin family protein